MYRFYLFCALSFFFFSSCQTTKDLPVEPGVSLTLARERAARTSDVRYDLFFSLPDSMRQPIPARMTATFNLSSRQSLQLDFREDSSHLLSVAVQGKPLTDFQFTQGHILIPAKYFKKGQNKVAIEFIAGDMSLNRSADYLYTLLVPDRASTAFPCFDQPDMKARYRLQLETPASWEALGNGPLESAQTLSGRNLYTYKETEPFSTYVFAFAAGRFRKITQSRDGREMTMYFRETDDAKVRRSADTIFDLHAQAIRWLEDYTQIKFPFAKLDFALMPGFQYGGMEHIGAIFYREASLMLDDNATENQKLGRARLIAHETAHMWFGDMVTMKWFNDVWLKEVFANFMAAKAVNPSFPNINHDLSFMLGHQPTAYSEDRSGGSHPIQQELENLREAGSLYGGIIYQKAPVVMRQLEALMGEDAFRDGLREYLKKFAYSNATWDDLISILDARTPADLREWSQAWVKESGMPVVSAELIAEGNKIVKLVIRQEKTSSGGRYWTQRTNLALFYPDSVAVIPMTISGPVTELTTLAGRPQPEAWLLNGFSMSYGYFKLSPVSQEYFLQNIPAIKAPLLRGAAWMALYEESLNGRLRPPMLLESVMAALPSENDPLNRQHLLGYVSNIFWRNLEPLGRSLTGPRLEALLWRLLEQAPDRGARFAFFNTYQSIATSDFAVKRLQGIWSGEVKVSGLTLSETQQIDLACELALRLPAQAESILDKQQASIANPDRRQRFAFVRPALSADPQVRDQFFESLKKVENRAYEPWVVEAVGYLHHPLRAAESEKYILPSLGLMEEIQRTGDIFFPRQFITATLGGHRSAAAAEIVRSFLAQHPGFSYRLRNKVLMAADHLFRVGR